MPGKSGSRKDAILRHALTLFAQKGYGATTTKEIAEASGVAEGLIFYYFGSKEQLMRSVMRSFSFAEQARQHANEWRELTGREALIRFAQLYLMFLERNKDYLMLIWSSELLRDSQANEEVLKLIQGMVDEGVKLTMNAVGVNQSLHAEKVETAVSMLLSSLFTYTVIQGRLETAHTLEANSYIETAVDIMLRGVE